MPSNPTLAARVSVQFPGLAKQPQATTSRGALLDLLLGNSTSLTAELLVQQEVQRVKLYLPDRRDCTVVFRHGKPAAFFDSELKAYADLSSIVLPEHGLPPMAGQEVQWREGDKESVAEITGHDVRLGQVRHVLTFSHAENLLPFGEAVFRLLFCPSKVEAGPGVSCGELARKGFLIRARSYLGRTDEHFSEIVVEPTGVDDVSAKEFEAPRGYRPLDTLIPTGRPRDVEPSWGGRREAPDAGTNHPIPPPPHAGQVGQSRQALHAAPRPLPDCLGSTTLGPMVATLHQDLLNHVSRAVNLAAPLLGTTTIAGGSWTIPWLSSLAAAAPTAPGSGMFCFLRDPRVLSTAPGGPSGGSGLLDRLAFRALVPADGDDDGPSRTEREFIAGTLASTLARWGVGPPIDAALMAASGDIKKLPLDDQRVIVEAYETSELGVVTVSGIPTSLPPFSWGSITLGPITVPTPVGTITVSAKTPDLMTVNVTGIGGTVNFASLGPGGLMTATIGGAGNIVLAISLPAITLAATISRSLTTFGWLLAGGGTVAFCYMFPFFCFTAIVIVTLLTFVLNNVTALTATATGVTITLNVAYAFNATTGRVEPFVTPIASTGAVALTSTWVTPNLIGNLFDSLVIALGNALGAWLPLLVGATPAIVQEALRKAGLHLPVEAQTAVTAVAGSATSTAGSQLRLTADLTAVDPNAAQAFTTQVAPAATIAARLAPAHIAMRNALNPQPAAPPGPGPVLTTAAYVGIGVSQNVLNYYLFDQWTSGDFDVVVTDPNVIKAVLAAAPPKLFKSPPARIHLWPAACPRVELTPSEIAAGKRALLLFFDDVRACFELSRDSGGAEGFSGVWELSFNFKTSGTIEIGWPWLFSMRIDESPLLVAMSEPRSWEWVDPAIANVMATVTPLSLAPMADLLSQALVSGRSAGPVLNPASPGSWVRPLPAIQELAFPPVGGGGLKPQQLYLELMEHRKVLYILPALDTTLLQLVDGSGAPDLKALLSLPATSTVTFATMTCAQGTTLRNLLALMGPAGP